MLEVGQGFGSNTSGSQQTQDKPIMIQHPFDKGTYIKADGSAQEIMISKFGLIREIAQKLLDITRNVQADGVVLECVDYKNYAFYPKVQPAD